MQCGNVKRNIINFIFSLRLVHPCDKESKGGCEQTCEKDGEKVVCSCAAPDYKLAGDGKSCEEGEKEKVPK